MTAKKGIILAGGTGSRLYPLTTAVNKQLLPIFDKPTIYYPLSTLILAGITDIRIISTPNDTPAIERLIGDGKQFGLTVSYMVQDAPKGLPEAFTMSRDFINREPVAMVLGDNLFHGNGFSSILINATDDVDNANVFLYSVKDPSRYGVGKFNDNNNLIDVIEKPTDYISSWAVTGLYMFPGDVADRAASLKPSPRGETEITDLIRTYINEGRVKSNCLARGNVWFDVGTPDSLLQASLFVEMMQNRQNILIASPEEIAWRMGMITQQNYIDLISTMPKSQYRNALELTLIP